MGGTRRSCSSSTVLFIFSSLVFYFLGDVVSRKLAEEPQDGVNYSDLLVQGGRQQHYNDYKNKSATAVLVEKEHVLELDEGSSVLLNKRSAALPPCKIEDQVANTGKTVTYSGTLGGRAIGQYGWKTIKGSCCVFDETRWPLGTLNSLMSAGGMKNDGSNVGYY